ncbi:hypothetical protein HHK36_001688 [Tetracentron sinense]|uniref:non-specific serine/threonine protein kinase n=1 Tax=Tetracentron sinense TaxID=13715 RepID=A0A834ZUG7_TETSI|nr:hypothetical protein HHK36_001688 [Tetracentron sinense]
MNLGWSLCWIFVHRPTLLIYSSNSIKAQSFHFPIAYLSTSWTNNPSIENSVNFTDGSMVRFILPRGSFGPGFGCGFYCNGTCHNFLFAVFIFEIYSDYPKPQVVWSANRNNPVREKGNFATHSRRRLDIARCQRYSGLSFDHPTDSLVPGQKLVAGQSLTSGIFSLSVSNEGLIASFESNPPQLYYNSMIKGTKENKEPSYVTFLNEKNEWKEVVDVLKSDLAPTLEAYPTHVTSGKRTSWSAVLLGSSLGSFGLFLLIIMGIVFSRKKRYVKEEEEDYLDEVPGMPTRFSYEDLKGATENFTRKLGEGGFGSVFEGTLNNGIKIAVKHLNGLRQVKKSFLAEVETIGSIHHVNLIRLIGFCAEKSHKLLVYEYMCNGSLDNWIFHKNQLPDLDWQSRRKIIYLHEDCRQRIVHLNIKPQNILLDNNFNTKVSDFGLSKLIDRDQGQVVTTTRGTPGYMAPEWLNSVITEKVDVYSFGVVVMEILCGRKILNRSQPEESMYLLSLFKRKAKEEQLFDLVDQYSEDLQLYVDEVMEMMKIAAWCLQSDFSRRPSMSAVVKVLRGRNGC